MERMVSGPVWLGARNGSRLGTSWRFVSVIAGFALALLLSPAVQAAAPPDRTYEQVTPVFKNAADLGAFTGRPPNLVAKPAQMLASYDGERAIASAASGFEEPNSLVSQTLYLFERERDGWRTTPLNPAIPTAQNNEAPANFVLDPIPYGATDDLTGMAFFSRYVLDPARDLDRGGGNGDADVYRVASDGGLELLTCPAPPNSACDGQVSVQGSVTGAMSSDGSRVVFETSETFRGPPPDTSSPGDPLFPGATGTQVYERAGDELRWVSQLLDTPLPDGATQVSGIPSVGRAPSANITIGPPSAVSSWPNAISPDGSRIFFLAPVASPAPRLYLRIDGSETREVSRVRGGDATNLGVAPKGMSADGNRAFFASAQALLPSSGPDPALIDPNALADLYAWQYDPATGTDSLVRVTGLGQVGGGPPADGDKFENVLGMSPDGSRLYFVSRSPSFSSGNPGRLNLYVADNPTDPQDGTVRFIATVFTGTSYAVTNPPTCLSTGNPQTICSRAAPDGRFLVFESRLPLTADDRDTDGTSTCDTMPTGAIPAVCMADVFVYDAASAELSRVSIGAAGPAGAPGNGAFDAFMGMNHPAVGGVNGNSTRQLNVTPDGTVFFMTAERLVLTDVNDSVDVYEYRDGAVALVSGGDGDQNSIYFGNSVDGRDVFFITIDGLVLQDGDGAVDIYDARVGGGFPLIDQQICNPLADVCQGSPSPPPARPPVESTGPGGPDASPGRRAQVAIRVLSARARRRAARTGVLRLGVRTNLPGMVSAVARARLSARGGSRTRRVARDRTRAARPSTVTLTLRLSKPARRQLRARRRLPVSVRVTFRRARARSTTVVLRLPGQRANSSESARNAR